MSLIYQDRIPEKRIAENEHATEDVLNEIPLTVSEADKFREGPIEWETLMDLSPTEIILELDKILLKEETFYHNLLNNIYPEEIKKFQEKIDENEKILGGLNIPLNIDQLIAENKNEIQNNDEKIKKYKENINRKKDEIKNIGGEVDLITDTSGKLELIVKKTNNNVEAVLISLRVTLKNYNNLIDDNNALKAEQGKLNIKKETGEPDISITLQLKEKKTNFEKILKDIENHLVHLKILKKINQKFMRYANNLPILMQEIGPKSQNPILNNLPNEIRNVLLKFNDSFKAILVAYYGSLFTPRPKIRKNLNVIEPINTQNRFNSNKDSTRKQYNSMGPSIINIGNKYNPNSQELSFDMFSREQPVMDSREIDQQNAQARISLQVRDKDDFLFQVRFDYKESKITGNQEIVLDVEATLLYEILYETIAIPQNANTPAVTITQDQRVELRRILYDGLYKNPTDYQNDRLLLYHHDITEEKTILGTNNPNPNHISVPREVWTHICGIFNNNLGN